MLRSKIAGVAASRGPAAAARCEKGLLEGNLGAAWWGASRGGCAQLAPVPYGYGCRLRGQQAVGGQQAAEGRGIHRSRARLGNGAFARLFVPCPYQSVPVAPSTDALGALPAVDFGRSGVSLWTDEAVFALQAPWGVAMTPDLSLLSTCSRSCLQAAAHSGRP